jgi:DNA-binding NtrC family response regulator
MPQEWQVYAHSKDSEMKNKDQPALLLIDDDIDLLELLGPYFRQRGYVVITYADARTALADIESNNVDVDVVISDLKLPMFTGLDFIKKIRAFNATLPIILMTGEGTLELAMEAISAGAYDFVLKPLHVPQLLLSVQRAVNLSTIQKENYNLRTSFGSSDFYGMKGVVGKSAGFKSALDLAKRVSSSPSNIIIFGESGTGKEVIARAVHELGDRKDGPFVAINCSAIPENLLESELFGFSKGAFTGAVGARVGLFEEANKGTIFLDEIGDLALPLQAKLLRVLQERKIKRIGENQPRDITCRVICATHKDLKKEVEKGNFREDLYFRLNVIPIVMPPLRERVEDILPLSEYFLKKFSLLSNTKIKGFTKEAMIKLENLPWKGNVRELENAIERAVVLSDGEYVDVSDLPNGEIEKKQILAKEEVVTHNQFFGVDELVSIEDLNRKYIEYVYKKNGNAKEQTARELGIDRKTLYRKLKEIGNEEGIEYGALN